MWSEFRTKKLQETRVQQLTGWQFSVHLTICLVLCSCSFHVSSSLGPTHYILIEWMEEWKLIVITSLSTSVSELHLVQKKSAIQRNNLKGCKTFKSRLSGEAGSASADAPSNHWLCDAALLLGLSFSTSSGQHYRKIGMLTNIEMLQVSTVPWCVFWPTLNLTSGLNEVVLVQATNFTQQEQHLCLGVVLSFSLRLDRFCGLPLNKSHKKKIKSR